MRSPFAPLFPALLLALLLALASVAAAQSPGQDPDPAAVLDDLGDFMAQAMRDWDVPGASVAVVKDGRTVYAKGFGLRNVDAKLPVTPDTVFAIGSCTKAFTAAALCLLADQGAIGLDAPVRDVMPAFRLFDDYATAHATPRDMLLHRTGLPRFDALIALRPDLTRQEIVEALRHLEPNKELRSGFEYNNLVYAAAGRLVEVVSGKSWEDFVAERFFAPLGMASASFDPERVRQSPDHALPYALRRGRLVELPRKDITPIGPAGSINASVADMARWLAFQLGDGRVGDVPILSKKTMTLMHTPQIITPSGEPNPEIPFGGYGLGWGVTAYRGHLLVLHDGEIDGFKALASLMPDDGLGVAVLTNRTDTPLPEIVAFQVYDRLLGLSPFPWGDRAKARRAETEKAEAAKKDAPRKDPGTPAPATHALAEYAGTFVHPAFGQVVVSHRDGTLEATLGGETFPLIHTAYDMFRAGPSQEARDRDEPAEDLSLKFRMDDAGAIARLDIPLQANAKDIVFTRAATGPGQPSPSGTAGGVPQGATRP